MTLGRVFLYLQRRLGAGLAGVLPENARQGFIARAFQRSPLTLLEAVGPQLNRRPSMDALPLDLPNDGVLQFEHLAGLFASTALDHGIVSLPVRQAAYCFGLIRRMQARKVIEVGRYKGGSTLLMAAAMNGEGALWSIDVGEKEGRLFDTVARTFDRQLLDMLARFGLKNAHVLVGDSRTIEVDTGEVDVVFIDGDHTYAGVKNDFERFGRRARRGGAVLLDDCFDAEMFTGHAEGVRRLMDEVIAEGQFRLVKGVNRLAHLERMAGR